MDEARFILPPRVYAAHSDEGFKSLEFLRNPHVQRACLTYGFVHMPFSATEANEETGMDRNRPDSLEFRKFPQYRR